MKPATLEDIALAVGGRLQPAEAGLVYSSGVSIDTRTIAPGEIFFALVDKRDGHNFLQDALKKGAVAAVVSKKIEIDLPQIMVRDTLRALGDLAQKYRRYLKLPIIAITGSLGKTTTRELIARVLRDDHNVQSSKNNFNNLMGLPLTILSINEEHTAAVVELGINRPGEMEILARIAAPDYAVVTNIAPVHLERLGTLERIASEKLRLLDWLKPNGLLFISADDETLMKQEIIPKNRVRTFGFSDRADYRITDYKMNSDSSIEYCISGKRIKMRICGKGFALAGATAFAIGTEMGISSQKIIERISAYEGLNNRLHIERRGDLTIIDDSYNSSPKALEEALDVLSKIEGKRKIAILADMLELGENEVLFHEKMGSDSVKSGVDKLFLFGKLSENARKTAIAGGLNDTDVFWTDEYEALKTAVLGEIRAGDIVLIKGSHSMGMERIVAAIKEVF